MVLFVGGKYLKTSGNGTRIIERIHGDDVYWRDDVGPGRCSLETFSRMVSGLAEDSPPQPVERPRRKQIKQEVIAAIQAEAELMHSFIARTRILFGSLDANRHDFTRMAIGLLLGMADDLESDLIMRSGTRPLRYLTGLDRSAKLCLLSIGSLIEALNSG